jgi:phage anti-repressor protein
MINTIVPNSDIKSLLDGWIEAERNGVQFPVPFDLAWGIAGYSRKDHAKRRLIAKTSRLIENSDYLLTSGESRQEGRSSDEIRLTCDAFKQFCLMADTEEGRSNRQYFIEAEKNWRLVQEVSPQFAEEIEVLKLKREIAQIEAQKAAIEDKTLSLRHYVVTALPKPTADRILGITEVSTIEYRDRVVKDNQVINDGSTINKTAICKRYGILTKAGSPDFKKLNTFLGSIELPNAAWEETDVIQTNRELRLEYLEVLDRSLYTVEQRQMWLGESA